MCDIGQQLCFRIDPNVYRWTLDKLPLVYQESILVHAVLKLLQLSRYGKDNWYDRAEDYLDDFELLIIASKTPYEDMCLICKLGLDENHNEISMMYARFVLLDKCEILANLIYEKYEHLFSSPINAPYDFYQISADVSTGTVLIGVEKGAWDV